MNILFLNHADFSSNSMGHIAALANRLTDMGESCVVSVPDSPQALASLDNLPSSRFIPRLHGQLLGSSPLFPDGRHADIIHAWTPREIVRKAAFAYCCQVPEARLVVHLEDNEEYLLEKFTGKSMKTLSGLDELELEHLLPEGLSHPRRYRLFLRCVDGVTGIVQELREFVPGQRPFHLFIPGLDSDMFQPCDKDAELLSKLGIGEQERILCYIGGVHFGNREEMRALYTALQIINEKGVPCRLIQTGGANDDFIESLVPGAAPYVMNLGFVPKAELPMILGLADVLVQPGKPDDFNRYRLPSKLPEFLGMGKPVIMPRANLGSMVADGKEALLLDKGSPEEIAAKCLALFSQPELAARLGQAGRAFALRTFNIQKTAEDMSAFYASLILTTGGTRLFSGTRPEPAMVWTRLLRRTLAAVQSGDGAAEADLGEVLTGLEKEEDLQSFLSHAKSDREGIARLYYNTGAGFTEKQFLARRVALGREVVEFDLSDLSEIHALRFDPAETPAKARVLSIVLTAGDEEVRVKEYSTNAYSRRDDLLLFESDDPQITIEWTKTSPLHKAVFFLEYVALGKEALIRAQHDRLEDTLGALAQARQMQQEMALAHEQAMNEAASSYERALDEATRELAQANERLTAIESSFSWRAIRTILSGFDKMIGRERLARMCARLRKPAVPKSAGPTDSNQL